jgi:hypothetical protein
LSAFALKFTEAGSSNSQGGAKIAKLETEKNSSRGGAAAQRKQFGLNDPSLLFAAPPRRCERSLLIALY